MAVMIIFVVLERVHAVYMVGLTTYVTNAFVKVTMSFLLCKGVLPAFLELLISATKQQNKL